MHLSLYSISYLKEHIHGIPLPYVNTQTLSSQGSVDTLCRSGGKYL